MGCFVRFSCNEQAMVSKPENLKSYTILTVCERSTTIKINSMLLKKRGIFYSLVYDDEPRDSADTLVGRR